MSRLEKNYSSISFDNIEFNDQWEYRNPETNFCYRIGIMPGRIFFSSIQGHLTENEVCNASSLLDGIYQKEVIKCGDLIRIIDYSGVSKASIGLFKAFAWEQNRLHEKYCSQPLVTYICGINSFTKIAFRFFSIFSSQHLVLNNTVKEAMAQINRQHIKEHKYEDIRVRHEHIEEISELARRILLEDKEDNKKQFLSSDNPLHEIEQILITAKDNIEQFQRAQKALCQELQDTYMNLVKSLAGFDLNSGQKRESGDQTEYIRILSKFFLNYKNFINDIQKAIAKTDTDKAIQLTHTLKSLVKNIDDEFLYKTVTYLEAALINEKIDQAGLLVDDIDDRFDQILASLKSIINKEKKSYRKLKYQITEKWLNCDNITELLPDLNELIGMDVLKDKDKQNGLVRVLGDVPGLNNMQSALEDSDYDRTFNLIKTSTDNSELSKKKKDKLNNFNKKKSILVVDDAKENLDVLVYLFKDKYTVLTASNGPSALQMVLTKLPDLILLDIMMPGMDGYEVCQHLKNDDYTKNIPIIFLTALTEAIDEVKAFDIGAVDYITKPFQLIDLKNRVRTHLKLKEKHDMLESLVSLDGLTNIFNRRKFDDILYQEWRRSKRNNQSLSLIILDIDNFKLLNDYYGHAYGDECLKKVANELKNNLKRSSDFLGRYGGEEFVVLLPDTEIKGAINVAEKLIKAISDLKILHEYSRTGKHLTLSAGVASITSYQDKNSPSLLIEAADEMLYKSKKNGRNQVNGLVI